MKRSIATLTGCALLLLLLGATNAAAQLSGAIFTTNFDASEVNANIYAAKSDVYLNGGPGVNAPDDAAGLPPGTYVFQVTSPSGKTLLSTDPPICRQVIVGAGGFITDVVLAGGCEHHTETDSVTGGKTVQLIPYNDTPNNGGVYKAWMTPLDNFLANCPNLNTNPPTGCGFKAGENIWGFTPSASKTDNFKVNGEPLEIDARFFKNGVALDGIGISHIDTLGASNVKWSDYKPQINVFHEAHVEAVEEGLHQIVLTNQSRCTIGDVKVGGKKVNKSGPQILSVRVAPNPNYAFNTIWVDVTCR